jgi:hypothetical protein
VSDASVERSQATRLLAIAAVAAVLVPLVWAAAAGYPQSDDGYIALTLKEYDRELFFDSIRDRPLTAWLWWALLPTERAAVVDGVACQAILWMVLAIATAWLWARLNPAAARYRALAAMLVVAPIAVQVQVVTSSFTLQGLASTVAVYLAVLLLWREVERARIDPLVVGAAYALAIVGVLLTEYAVAAGLCGAALLALGARGEGSRRTASLVAGGLLVALALSYVGYVTLMTAEVRPNVHPSYAIDGGWSRLIAAPVAIAAETFRMVVGAYATALGVLARVDWGSKSTVIVGGYGVAVAALVAAAWRAPRSESERSVEDPRWRAVAVAVVAVAIGIAPVAVMGRGADNIWNTRFFTPVLPAAAIATLATLLLVVRERARLAALALVGFVSGAASMATAIGVVRQTRATIAAGELVRPLATEDGRVVVAVLAPSVFSYRESVGGWEATAQMTHAWPAELSRRAWAFTADEARELFGERGACHDTSHIDIVERGVVRRGPIGEIVWIEKRDGALEIEPYCLGRTNDEPNETAAATHR